MSNMTLAVPDDVHARMKHFSEVRWSEVARKAIVEKLETLEIAESLARKSKLTPHQAKIFDKKIKALSTQRFHEENRP